MRRLFAVAIAIVTFACAKGALAWGPSAAILVGNGFKENYGVGVGVRAGVALPMLPVYVGGTFMYHVGAESSDDSNSLFYLGAETGYELPLGPVTVRPYLGFGYASLHQSSWGAKSSASKFALWPGVTGLFAASGPIIIGADLRYTVITDTTDRNAFGAFATAGLSF